MKTSIFVLLVIAVRGVLSLDADETQITYCRFPGADEGIKLKVDDMEKTLKQLGPSELCCYEGVEDKFCLGFDPCLTRDTGNENIDKKYYYKAFLIVDGHVVPYINGGAFKGYIKDKRYKYFVGFKTSQLKHVIIYVKKWNNWMKFKTENGTNEKIQVGKTLMVAVHIILKDKKECSFFNRIAPVDYNRLIVSFVVIILVMVALLVGYKAYIDYCDHQYTTSYNTEHLSSMAAENITRPSSRILFFRRNITDPPINESPDPANQPTVDTVPPDSPPRDSVPPDEATTRE